jgi:nicotinamide riboside kinase
MKKVALVGTHAVTKSTLCFEIAWMLKKHKIDCDICTETARECPLPINESTTQSTQEWIIHKTRLKEIEQFYIDNVKVLVCDRSILDGYVYYYHSFGRDYYLEQLIKRDIRSYDLLYKVPTTFSQLKDDGKRSINKQFQLDINDEFDHLIKELNIEIKKFDSTQSVFNDILNLF